MADEVVVGYAGVGGNLEKLLRTINKSWMMIEIVTSGLLLCNSSKQCYFRQFFSYLLGSFHDALSLSGSWFFYPFKELGQ